MSLYTPLLYNRIMIISRQHGQIVPVTDRATVRGLIADKDNLLWIDLSRPTQDDLQWLSDTFGFHALALEDATKQKQRSKVETFDDYFFVVAHAVKPSKKHALDLVELHFFVGADYLVSIRHDSFEPLENLLKSADQSRYLQQGPDFLLYALMDMAIDTYFPAMDKIDDAIDRMDRKLLEAPARDDI